MNDKDSMLVSLRGRTMITPLFVFLTILFFSNHAQASLKSNSSEENKVWQLWDSGKDAFENREYEKCEAVFADAIQRCKQRSLTGLELLNQWWLAKTYCAEGKFENAKNLCNNKISQLKRSGKQPHLLVQVLVDLGCVQRDEGNLKEAKQTFERALSFAKAKDTDSFYGAAARLGLASVQFKEGHSKEAISLLEEVLELNLSNNYYFTQRASTAALLASLYENQGDAQRVEELYQNAISNYEYNDRFNQEGLAQLHADYGSFLSRKMQLKAAEREYKEAFDIYAKYGSRSKAAQKCQTEYANLLRKTNRSDEAKQIEDAK